MRSRRAKILVAVAGAAIIALAVGLTLWLTSGDSKESTPTHFEFAQLYSSAALNQKEADILAQWPKKPYQSYHDGTGHQCYEWYEKYDDGKSQALYDLCFKNGRLTKKFRP